MTRRSIYEFPEDPSQPSRLVIRPSEARYLFVYPFTKTRPWYMLPKAERQTMMDEHVRIGRQYPSIRLNTTYSYGLDDQEFIVAFEGDNPSDFLDLVMELRESKASSYTLRDTPTFTCVQMSLWDMLDTLGGAGSVQAVARRPARADGFTPVATLAELRPGSGKRVYAAGEAVALFNVNGSIYAISNRCTHARGSLSEGTVDPAKCAVTCPWHEGVFALETGQVLAGPPSLPVPTYQVKLEVDAAIIFADILLPFEPLGLGLSFTAGEGPHIAHPIRDAARVAALPRADPERELSYVLEAVRLAARALPPGVPLIGFAGAPFTLASYAIEGGASRSFARTKGFMHGEPAAWHALLDRLAELVGRYLAAQAGAGARALQLFDSWVGCLSPADYREYVLPHSRRALELAGAAGVPVIHFGTDTATFLEDFAAAGGDVIGVDWRIPLGEAWRRIGGGGAPGDHEPGARGGDPGPLRAHRRRLAHPPADGGPGRGLASRTGGGAARVRRDAALASLHRRDGRADRGGRPPAPRRHRAGTALLRHERRGVRAEARGGGGRAARRRGGAALGRPPPGPRRGGGGAARRAGAVSRSRRRAGDLHRPQPAAAHPGERP